MQYVVIVATCQHPDDKRGRIQYLECQSQRDAQRTADAIGNVMADTSASVGLRIYQPKGGSVVLELWQVSAIAEFYLEGGNSFGKPNSVAAK